MMAMDGNPLHAQLAHHYGKAGVELQLDAAIHGGAAAQYSLKAGAPMEAERLLESALGYDGAGIPTVTRALWPARMSRIKLFHRIDPAQSARLAASAVWMLRPVSFGLCPWSMCGLLDASHGYADDAEQARSVAMRALHVVTALPPGLGGRGVAASTAVKAGDSSELESVALAFALAQRAGDNDRAAEAARDAVQLTSRTGWTAATAVARWALAHVWLREGDLVLAMDSATGSTAAQDVIAAVDAATFEASLRESSSGPSSPVDAPADALPKEARLAARALQLACEAQAGERGAGAEEAVALLAGGPAAALAPPLAWLRLRQCGALPGPPAAGVRRARPVVAALLAGNAKAIAEHTTRAPAEAALAAALAAGQARDASGLRDAADRLAHLGWDRDAAWARAKADGLSSPTK